MTVTDAGAITVVRSPRARTMRLVVDPRSGAVKLTIPKRGALGPAMKWAATKQAWIDAQLAKLPCPQPIENGMTVMVAGDELQIDWCEAYPRAPVRFRETLRVGGPRDGLSARVIGWLKREAVRVLDAETRDYAAKINVSIARVGVGDPVSRWGSCAITGDIRYSWRLILAPDHVRRATVAHEVAHRIHMNHGPAFHALVADLFEGDPAVARAWLRTHGTALHWFGRQSI